MKTGLITAAWVVACLAGCAPASSPRPINSDPTITTVSTSPPTTDPNLACLSTHPRQWEICTAYTVNASLTARYPYYQAADSSDQHLASAARDRLGSRYTGRAFDILATQTQSWPTNITVQLPIIRISHIDIAADGQTATLATRETWRVTDRDNQPRFEEKDKPHIITLAKIPGVVLEKWVVTDIR